MLFKTLPIALTAIARDRVVFGIDHRVVDLESSFLESDGVPKARECFVAIQRAIANDPNDNAARFCLVIKGRCDVLNRKMVAIVVAQIVVRRARDRHIDEIIRHPAESLYTVFVIYLAKLHIQTGHFAKKSAKKAFSGF